MVRAAKEREPQVDAGQPKRCAILEAALRLFARNGYAGTPIPELAAAAGVATGTIYRYFRDKDALVNQLYRTWKRQLRDALVAAVGPEMPPRQVFGAFWRALVEFERLNPDAFVFLEYHFHASYLDQESLGVEQELVEFVRRVITGAQTAGGMRPLPPDLVSALVFGAFVNLVRQRRLGSLNLTDSLLAEAEAALWRMVAPEAGSSGRPE